MNGMECLGCGSCSFVCPARRMLAPSIQEHAPEAAGPGQNDREEMIQWKKKKYRWIFPHVKGTMTTAGMMRMMLLALLPAEIFGVLHFGPRVLLHLLICIVTCTLTEFTYEAFRDKPLTVTDGSAMVTGVLLASDAAGERASVAG